MNQTIFRVKKEYRDRFGDKIVVFSHPITAGYNICCDGNGYYFPEQLEPLNNKELESFLSTFENKTLGDILAEKVGNKRGGVCSFALLGKGQKLHQADISVAAPCHYHFAFDGEREVEQAYTHNFYFFNDQEKEQCRELVSWIMNGSPWLHCIHPSLWLLSPNERTDWALNKPVPVNVEAPANEVMGFVVALRVITEHGTVLPTYLALREKGLSRAQAFLLSAFLILRGDEWSVWGNYNWHHFLSLSQRLPDVIRFFKEGYFIEDRSLSPFKSKRYKIVASQCAKEYRAGDPGSVYSDINKFLIVGGNGWEKQTRLDVDNFIKFFKEEWNK